MKKALALMLALALCLGLGSAVFAADPQPASSSNKNRQDYSTWASPVKSYLYENTEGGLTRVELLGGDWTYSYTGGQWQPVQSEQKIVVEDYSGAFAFQSGRTIPMELSIWGGFFAGKDYNFLIFGQNNEEETKRSSESSSTPRTGSAWVRPACGGPTPSTPSTPAPCAVTSTAATSISEPAMRCTKAAMASTTSPT